MSERNFLEWSIEKLSKSIQNKEISPVEVTEENLTLIAERNDEMNAFTTVMVEESRQAAAEAEKDILAGNYKGPLHGVPIGIKDLVCTAGVKTTFGSETHKDYVPDFDAEVITKLKNAGSIIIGKQTMHAFAYGPTGDRSYYGAVKNPHNMEKITGGSSSGSGAAVASFQSYGAIGSDTGGSIRMPASICGLVGMKPTFGRVSKYGSLTLCPTLDHLGPMTRTVTDNALMLNALSGFDSKDPYSIATEEEDFTKGLDAGVKNKKIGIPTSYYFDVLDPEIRRIFEKTAENLRQQGAEVVPIDLPGMADLLTAQQIILASEAYTSLKKHLVNTPQMVDDEVRDRSIAGMLIQASEYIEMLQVRHQAINMHMKAFEKVDAIMTPTLAMLPTDIDQRDVMIDGVQEHTRTLAKLTGPSNTTGFPAISVPGGLSACGLPVGIQFIGKPRDEKQLYQIAYALEQAGIYKSPLTTAAYAK